MADAGAGAHLLPLARAEDRAVAHAVAVLRRAGQHVGQDFHVGVAVQAEAPARPDAVLVDDPQGPETLVRRVVIIGEGKRVVGVEPTVVEMAALGGPPWT